MEAMLYNCSANMLSPLLIASTYSNASGHFSPTVISVQVSMNNLVSVDSTLNQATLSFYLRFKWRDPRWVIPPEVWKQLNPAAASSDGIEILDFVQNQTPLNLWYPSAFFFQEWKAQTILAEKLSLFPNGVLYWGLDVVIDFSQARMSYESYPKDVQTFSLSLSPFSYSNAFIVFDFIANTPITFVQSPSQHSANLIQNQLWKYDSSDAYTTLVASPNFANPHRAFSYAIYNFKFSRVSEGIINRLAVPVMIFLIIVGVSFWSEIDKRIDVTLQVMLVVSAMYLIIGSTIPMVGYLSKMDWYITNVFILLAVVVGVHFMTGVFLRKKLKYPLLGLLAILVVSIFRIFWLPCVLGLFMGYFSETGVGLTTVLVLFATAACAYGISISGSWWKDVHAVVLEVKKKAEQERLGNIDKETNHPIKLTILENAFLRFVSSRGGSLSNSTLNKQRSGQIGDSAKGGIEMYSMNNTVSALHGEPE